MSGEAEVHESLNAFLEEVQASAFRLAVMSVRNEADALDICQDAMLTLAERYAHKPSSSWRPLFFRILRNRITDSHRSGQRRAKLFASFSWRSSTADPDDEPASDPIASAEAPNSAEPVIALEASDDGEQLVQAVEVLPERQRQAFVLRAVEGMDVRETAFAMGCSAGSVKTHYSRALTALRAQLEAIRP